MINENLPKYNWSWNINWRFCVHKYFKMHQVWYIMTWCSTTIFIIDIVSAPIMWTWVGFIRWRTSFVWTWYRRGCGGPWRVIERNRNLFKQRKIIYIVPILVNSQRSHIIRNNAILLIRLMSGILCKACNQSITRHFPCQFVRDSLWEEIQEWLSWSKA